MRITIEPTRDTEYHKVVIEKKDSDDPGLESILELVRHALLGYGYCGKNLNEIFGE